MIGGTARASWLTGALAAVAALTGCTGVADGADPPRVKFLRMVTPEVDMTLWTDEELVHAGRSVCAVLEEAGGDKDAVTAMHLSALSPSDSELMVKAWLRDVSAIEAGAVLYFCPEWEGSYR